MSRLTLGQKADRVLKLLMGMRNARVRVRADHARVRAG